MSENDLTMKNLTQMINSILGQNVLTEQQMEQIMKGAKKANEKGGMPAVLDYLLKVTQADVEKDELKQFADQIQSNPQTGMDILQGKKKVNHPKK